MGLPSRLLAWAFGAWSSTAVATGAPPYYSFRGAIRGVRDAWRPPSWALDEVSPLIPSSHVPLAEWVDARSFGSCDCDHWWCDCDHWWHENCACKGACDCHWKEGRTRG
jgi:hypothetical protein